MWENLKKALNNIKRIFNIKLIFKTVGVLFGDKNAH